MNIKARFKLAQEAGPKYTELAQIFEAASTSDFAKLNQFKNSPSKAVNFAYFINKRVGVSKSDLGLDPLIKFAAVFNSSTSTEVLNEIEYDQSLINPVIWNAIRSHKNVSKESQVFQTLSPLDFEHEGVDESERYFAGAIYESSKKNFTYADVRYETDLENLEALFYLHILGFIDAPQPASEFWSYIEDSRINNLNQNLELFGSLPAIPKSLSHQYQSIIGARCLAAAFTKNLSLMHMLSWDKELVSTGIGGNFWQDSRSPRSSVAFNEFASPLLLRSIFKEESENIQGLDAFPHPELWRLSCNPNTPQDVLAEIVTLIENELVSDEMTRGELLIGHKDDYPFGLFTHTAISGELRRRVVKLLKLHKLRMRKYFE